MDRKAKHRLKWSSVWGLGSSGIEVIGEGRESARGEYQRNAMTHWDLSRRIRAGSFFRDSMSTVQTASTSISTNTAVSQKRPRLYSARAQLLQGQELGSMHPCLRRMASHGVATWRGEDRQPADAKAFGRVCWQRGSFGYGAPCSYMAGYVLLLHGSQLVREHGLLMCRHVRPVEHYGHVMATTVEFVKSQ